MSRYDVLGQCAHCGGYGHRGVCPRIQSITYYPDGTVKSITYKPNPPSEDLPPGPYPETAVSRYCPEPACPVCGGPPVVRCRCPLADMRCVKGHDWHACASCHAPVVGPADHTGKVPRANLCRHCAVRR